MVSVHESSCFSTFYYLCTLSYFCHPCSVMLYCACFFSPSLQESHHYLLPIPATRQRRRKKKNLKKKFRRWKNSTHNAQQSQTYTSCPLPGTRLKSYPELFNPLASTIRVCCQCHVSLILSTLCSRNDIRSNNANYNLISEKFFLLEQH